MKNHIDDERDDTTPEILHNIGGGFWVPEKSDRRDMIQICDARGNTYAGSVPHMANTLVENAMWQRHLQGAPVPVGEFVGGIKKALGVSSWAGSDEAFVCLVNAIVRRAENIGIIIGPPYVPPTVTNPPKTEQATEANPYAEFCSRAVNVVNALTAEANTITQCIREQRHAA